MKTWKITLTSILFLLIGLQTNLVYSQPAHMPPRPKYRPFNPMNSLSKEGRYKVLRSGGVVVIGAGSALLTAITRAQQKQNEYLKENPQSHGSGLADLGRAFGKLVGIGWILGGTSMTVIANRNLDKARRISVTGNGHSAGFVYRF